jgi:transcriptional regulator with XRE-family HTH domain
MTSFEFDKVRQRMKSVRNSLGKNQTEMGELTGKGVYYGNIERGNQEPALVALIDIATALNIDPDWLLYGAGKSPLPKKLQAKTPEIVIPTVEEKKELAPAPMPKLIISPGLAGIRSEPELEPIPKEKSNTMADYDAIANAERRLMKSESQVLPVPNITMKLRHGVFDFIHKDGLIMSFEICRDQELDEVIIDLQDTKSEFSIDEANQFADILRFAARQATEVLV